VYAHTGYRRLVDAYKFWGSDFLGLSNPKPYARLSDTVPPNFLRDTFSYWGYSTFQTDLAVHFKNILEREEILTSNLDRAQVEIKDVIDSTASLKQKVAYLESSITAAKSLIAALEGTNTEYRAQLAGALDQLGESQKLCFEVTEQNLKLLTSVSWRATRPLRWLTSLVRQRH
jgi:septal ring factor EnvC (AmiA/AmiB activator)